jgi:DEAD/DEAH box helicase domain-containing protein
MECHVGAVYLHRGEHWQVTAFDPDRRRVLVEEADGTWFTMPRTAKQTEILEVLDSRAVGATTAHFGRLRITQRMTGYEKRASFDQKLLGSFELDLPPTIYETEGLWIEAPGHAMAGLHGLEHAMIALSPLFTLCDPTDVGGITFVEHPQVPGGVVFLYDAFPGGIGLMKRTFGVLESLLAAVQARVERCDCDAGCPGCVHSTRCGAGNYPLDKDGTRTAVQALLEGPRRPPAARLLREPQVVYFDLETLRSAAEVGGWRHIHRMGMALAVVGDASGFTTYRDPEALVRRLRDADLVVGYNVLRFDYAVLSAYVGDQVNRIATFDILVELRALLRQRLGLAHVGNCTLGRGKTSDGLQSLEWVRRGELDRVEAYCRDDVALTRDVFLHGVEHGWLAFERKGRRLRTPPLDWNVRRLAQDAALRRAVRVRLARIIHEVADEKASAC